MRTPKAHPMPPVVVAVPGEQKGGDRLCRSLGGWLRQKGLRVQTLRTREEPLLTDSDIILIPCGKGEIPLTAERVEQLWSWTWANWYKALRANRKGARRAY